MRPLRATLLAATAAVAFSAPARAQDVVDLRRSAVVQAVEKARPGIVSIRTNQVVRVPRWYAWLDPEEQEEREVEASLGSGVIFHPDGYVITNAHVIARASRIIVTVYASDDRSYDRDARALAVDVDNDLAILRLTEPPDGAARYPFLSLGRSDDLMIGETVIAIGNPFRLGITVTTGIVSALHRTIRPKGARGQEFRHFIQTDAAINPGNSGGPILDITGRWIGVNTAILNRQIGAEGIGFAIPADRVRDMVGRLFRRRLATGEWLGIEVGEDDGNLVVTDVFPTGPAREAGLRRGDRIVAVNGTPTDTRFDYRFAEMGLSTGAPARLRVRRDGQDRDVTVALASVPTAELARRRLGIVVGDLDPTLRQGLLVREVVPDGPAAAAIGMRAGDVIRRLTADPRRSILNLDDLLLFLESVQPGDSIDIQIARGGELFAGVLRAR